MYLLKRTVYTLICCSFLIISCSDETEKASVTKVASDTNPQCYQAKSGEDVTVVQLQQEQGKVSGYYAWEPKEKDSGRGSFTGTIMDNKISAQYTYMIEGSVQTEEVAFKLDGDALIQGRGELIEKDEGVLAIKDPAKLEWIERFAKVDCKQVQSSIDNTKLTVEDIKKQK